MSATSGESRPIWRGRLPAIIGVGAVLLIAAILSTFVVTLAQFRDLALKRANERLAAVTTAAEMTLDSSFRRVEAFLVTRRSTLLELHLEPASPAAGEGLTQLLAEVRGDEPAVSDLLLVDAGGRVLLSASAGGAAAALPAAVLAEFPSPAVPRARLVGPIESPGQGAVYLLARADLGWPTRWLVAQFDTSRLAASVAPIGGTEDLALWMTHASAPAVALDTRPLVGAINGRTPDDVVRMTRYLRHADARMSLAWDLDGALEPFTRSTRVAIAATAFVCGLIVVFALLLILGLRQRARQDDCNLYTKTSPRNID